MNRRRPAGRADRSAPGSDPRRPRRPVAPRARHRAWRAPGRTIVGPEDEIQGEKRFSSESPTCWATQPPDAHDPPIAVRPSTPELAEIAVELVLRLVANRAGIDHQQIRLRLAGAGFESRRPRAADSRLSRSRGRSSGTRRCGWRSAWDPAGSPRGAGAGRETSWGEELTDGPTRIDRSQRGSSSRTVREI